MYGIIIRVVFSLHEGHSRLAFRARMILHLFDEGWRLLSRILEAPALLVRLKGIRIQSGGTEEVSADPDSRSKRPSLNSFTLTSYFCNRTPSPCVRHRASGTR